MPTSEQRLIRLSEDEREQLRLHASFQNARNSEYGDELRDLLLSLADRYEDAITEEEARAIPVDAQFLTPELRQLSASGHTKLRSLSQSTPEGER